MALADPAASDPPTSVQNVSQVKFMVFGAALMVLMRYRPQGIFGSREEMALDDR